MAFVGSRRTEPRSLYVLLEESEVIAWLFNYLIFSPLFAPFSTEEMKVFWPFPLKDA
jgi:hypothetical protein